MESITFKINPEKYVLRKFDDATMVLGLIPLYGTALFVVDGLWNYTYDLRHGETASAAMDTAFVGLTVLPFIGGGIREGEGLTKFIAKISEDTGISKSVIKSTITTLKEIGLTNIDDDILKAFLKIDFNTLDDAFLDVLKNSDNAVDIIKYLGGAEDATAAANSLSKLNKLGLGIADMKKMFGWPKINFAGLDDNLMKSFVDNFNEWSEGFEKIKKIVPDDFEVILKNTLESGSGSGGVSWGKHGVDEHFIELNMKDLDDYPMSIQSVLTHEAVENTYWSSIHNYAGFDYGKQESIVESISRQIMGETEFSKSFVTSAEVDIMDVAGDAMKGSISDLNLQTLAKNLAILDEIDNAAYARYSFLQNSPVWGQLEEMINNYRSIFLTDWYSKIV
jgi:hypothetical protein